MLAETDRFQGILEAHIWVMQGLADTNQRRLDEKKLDGFVGGLTEGGAIAYRACAEMLRVTLEKEKHRT